MKYLLAYSMVVTCCMAADQYQPPVDESKAANAIFAHLQDARSQRTKIDAINEATNYLLDHHSDPRLLAAVKAAFRDNRDKEVQETAFDALSRLGDESILPNVCARLKDSVRAADPAHEPRKNVRREATDRIQQLSPIVKRFRYERALPVLDSILKADYLADKHSLAVEVTAAIGGDKALAMLKAYLTTIPTDAENRSIRDATARAIADLERAKALRIEREKR